ncbi:Pathogenic type III effector avirulence factor Avr cleavage site [Corchorus capsularis]|uniref:Pathogenic type III effector avirulence factor Avr cleavage site n=1 Tax=Corchorus capsularis TaxID=210143 RepID=A0A1R3GCD8_COCAP|nr:Pathogenic type III effector avirulence factor Avr cleavage site [Corchorus capsularis]
MTASGEGAEERPLPRFGEWDVNDPATAEGFTVIFAKASDEKKAAKASRNTPSKKTFHHKQINPDHYKRKWLCCVFTT